MVKKPDTEPEKKAEGNKTLLFGIIFGAFIVAMIVAMLLLDIYAEKQAKEQSHATQPADAAER